MLKVGQIRRHARMDSYGSRALLRKSESRFETENGKRPKHSVWKQHAKNKLFFQQLPKRLAVLPKLPKPPFFYLQLLCFWAIIVPQAKTYVRFFGFNIRTRSAM